MAILSTPPQPPSSSVPCSSHIRLRRDHTPRRIWLLVPLVLCLLIGLPVLALSYTGPGSPARWSASHTHTPQPYAAVGGALFTPGACTESSVSAIGKNVVVDPGEWVCGDVSAYGGSIGVFGRVDGTVQSVGGNGTIAGMVQGAVDVVGGSVTVSGNVSGDVSTVGGNIDIQPGAHIGGNVHAVGGTVSIARQASVGGTVEQGFFPHNGGPMHWLGYDGTKSFPWLGILLWVLAGAGIARFLSEPLTRVRSIARTEVLSSAGAGAIALIGGAIGVVVLFITCLGIPLALLLAAALWAGWVLGTVAIGSWLGEYLLARTSSRDRAPLVSTMLGTGLIALSESLPCLGGIIALGVGCVGLGACVLAVIEARRIRHLRHMSRRIV